MTSSKPMTLFTRALLWLIAVNALAGAGALILFPTRTDQLFFWTIQPPINAALFGALYLGGAFAVGWAAWRGDWPSARYLVPVLVSAGILISITTLLHLDKFTSGIRLVYWLAVYLGAPVLAVAIYLVEERGGGGWEVREPVRLVNRVLAVLVGAGLALGGLVVLAFPGPLASAWPWPNSPLMVRIFTAWFSAFGYGLLWFAVERDWGRVRPIATLMIAAAILDLLMLAVHRADVTGSALSVVVYCAHLVFVGLLGAAMHLIQWIGKAASPQTPNA